MKIQTVRERLLASTIIGGAALAALAGAPAHAQDASNGTAVKEVVVTGSRIRQPNLTTTSPVTTVGQQEMKLEGANRVEDVLNSLPSVAFEQGNSSNNGSNGSATVSLRGLGSKRTLVLVDGRRLMPGDPTSDVPDLNIVPSALIERVDVVTGGASAVYGADAVAGVVNFVMKKNFEGIQIDATEGLYQHDNGDTAMQNAITSRRGISTDPSQFQSPASSYVGGRQDDITITVGANSADDKGNITAYFGYRHIEAVTQNHYDYGACAASDSGSKFICGGSSTSYPGRFQPIGTNVNTGLPNSTKYTIADSAGDVRPFISPNDQYNYAPYNYFQRPDTRYTGGFTGHYDVNKSLQVYSQFMFEDDTSVSNLAPSGIFTNELENVNCDNPLLSAAEVAAFCTSVGKSGSEDTQISIARRNVEGGPRIDTFHHTAYRMVLGARGDINDTWSYDVYGQYGSSTFTDLHTNDMSMSRIANSLEVVDVNGVATCKSVVNGTDPNCVPYNIWTPGGVTAAALKYLEVPGSEQGTTTEQVVSGALTGKLGNYGIRSPWAKEGVSLVIGAEYRRETLDFNPDIEYQSGDLEGNGSQTPATSGAYNVKEMFLEARIPILSDLPFAQDLSLDTGYRRSDYSSTGTNDTYKIEANWTPIRDIRFRGSFNRAVRAPNINELYTAQHIQLDGTTDPCSGAVTGGKTAAGYTLQQCALTGVTAPYFGNISPNSAAQYNGLVGGNPNLRPEIGDTYSFGTVFQPRFIPGFSLSVDYYNIAIKNVITLLGADTIINECLQTGDSAFCSNIHRDAATESLWLTQSGYITDTLLNAGVETTQGLDIQGNYRLPLERLGFHGLGRVDFSMIGTYVMQLHDQPLPGVKEGEYDCAGKYGPQCVTFGPINPRWRHKFRATWSTPWKVDASLQWRYIGGVTADSSGVSPGSPDYALPAVNYFDLELGWHLKDNIEWRFGVNNVLDQDPPVISTGALAAGNPQNGNAISSYDLEGRYLFTSITAKF